MKPFDTLEANSLECSPETPWGLHPPVTDNVCPRCGWVAREPASEATAAE